MANRGPGTMLPLEASGRICSLAFCSSQRSPRPMARGSLLVSLQPRTSVVTCPTVRCDHLLLSNEDPCDAI